MKTIRFTADTDPQRQGGDYKAGDIATLSVASAHHWLRRGVAVEFVADKPPEAPVLKLNRPMMGEKPKRARRKRKA